MARFTVARGNVSIEVGDGLAEMAEALVREAAPRTIEALERELDKIVADAVKVWPVGREREGKGKGRPHSRDLFTVTLRFDPGAFAVDAVIENTAGRGTPSKDYAYKIKTKAGISPWQTFIVKKVREAEKRLAEILAEELSAVLQAA